MIICGWKFSRSKSTLSPPPPILLSMVMRVDAGAFWLGRGAASFPECIVGCLVRPTALELTRVVVLFLITAETASNTYLYPRDFPELGARDAHVNTGKVPLKMGRTIWRYPTCFSPGSQSNERPHKRKMQIWGVSATAIALSTECGPKQVLS